MTTATLLDKSRLPAARDYYAPLKPRRANSEGWAMARCVFHDDHNPSLSLNIKTGAFRCLACGVGGGDVLAFHMRKHSMSFIEAARDLGAIRDDPDKLRQDESDKAAWRATAIWHAAMPAPAEHPYLVRKHLPACGARYLSEFAYSDRNTLRNALILCMYDVDGRIRNVQGIDANGSKRFLAGATTGGLMALPITRIDGKWIEPGSIPEVLGVAEGWASAASHHLIKGYATAAAMSASNLPRIAVDLRKKWPGAHLLIAADNDEAGAIAWGSALGLMQRMTGHTACELVRIEEDTPPPIYNDWADYRLSLLRDAHASA
jgi:phage/plasmid primase-like uncharacterized protein